MKTDSFKELEKRIKVFEDAGIKINYWDRLYILGKIHLEENKPQ